MTTKHMINKLLLLLLLGFVSFEANAQKSVRTARNDAFTFGEKGTYKVHYNLYFNIGVGEVNFEVLPNPENIGGNECYHIVATGNTYGFYDVFYKVRDKYETYVEVNSLLPLVFIRNVNEGKFSFDEYVIFNHFKNQAKSKRRDIINIPPFTQDVLSVIYYARTLDYKDAKEGQNFYMHAFIDDSAYQCGVQFAGREVIKTDLGKFRCIKLKPILVQDRMFKSQEGMTLWVTDDDNHAPIRIESGISVGKIRADLDSYSGLKNPFLAKQ
jgi:hypothetical protein